MGAGYAVIQFAQSDGGPPHPSKIDAQADPEGVEARAQVDPHVIGWRTAEGGSDTSRKHWEVLGVGAEVRVAVFEPRLDPREYLCFCAGADRAADSYLRPAARGPCEAGGAAKVKYDAAI